VEEEVKKWLKKKLEQTQTPQTPIKQTPEKLQTTLPPMPTMPARPTLLDRSTMPERPTLPARPTQPQKPYPIPTIAPSITPITPTQPLQPPQRLEAQQPPQAVPSKQFQQPPPPQPKAQQPQQQGQPTITKAIVLEERGGERGKGKEGESEMEEIKGPAQFGGLSKIIIIGIVAIVGIGGAITSLFFLGYVGRPAQIGGILPPMTNETSREYKISLAHNGNQLEITADSSYKEVEYGITLYNKSSRCGIKFAGSSGATNSSSYTFTNDATQGTETLKDYEKEDYAFAPNVFMQSFRPASVELISKNFLDAESNYEDFPKLSNDYSITFDVPILDWPSYSAAVSGKNLSISYKFAEDWNKQKNSNIYCRLSRDYEPELDAQIPDCPRQLRMFSNVAVQCAQRYSSECGDTVKVQRTIEAERDGLTMNCQLPISELTSGRDYQVGVVIYSQISGNLYQVFSVRRLGTVSIPSQ